MAVRKNLFELYIENNYKLGFCVSRDSWSDGKYAKVVAIDGVVDGQPIEGNPPYFNRIYPDGHEKAGATWQRNARLEAEWFDKGFQVTTGAGGYTWTKVYP
ncbi:MAG: hypothetical protein J0I41_22940 [Filimonas sp.]|nr:hypothetical protein [Filimonas sp.]